jgi:raffinose/stachyose/melibiose transport system substrate-binding protein
MSGPGKANDLFGSLDGWLITKDAPKETIDFMKVLLDKDTQRLFIPAVKGTADVIQDPLIKRIAEEIDKSQWIQIAMDQLLGPEHRPGLQRCERRAGLGQYHTRTGRQDH